MSYRRDAQQEEAIPLPLETVYCSEVNALIRDRNTTDGTTFDRFGVENFNKIFFKYPPEWKTADVGEKIIGIRKMTIHWKDDDIKFMLYVRKYKHFIPSSTDDVANQAEINDADDEELQEKMSIFPIPIHVRISSNDTWNDIKEKIMSIINQHNLYDYLYRTLRAQYSVPATLTPKLQQLDQIKDNYYAMLADSFNLIGEAIPFYLEPGDIDIVKTIDNGLTSIQFVSPQNNEDRHDFFVDFMIAPLAPHTRHQDATFNKLYEPNGRSKNPSVLFPGDLNFDDDKSPDLNKHDWFSLNTTDFFNIGYRKYSNQVLYVLRFHRTLKLMNMMSDLECAVAASFANQTTNYVIGRTNEMFVPIKYYKLNSNDDKFWIGFYDRDVVNIPIAFNSSVVFTIDMVFLQNRKLIYD